MFKPIDIYIHLNFLYPKYKYSRNQFEFFMLSNIPFQNGTPSLAQVEEMLEKRPPTITQQVQALDDLGIAPNKIAALLGITKQSVSYHRHRPQDEYYNPELNKYLTPRVERDFNSYTTNQYRKKRSDSSAMIRQRRQQLDELVNRNQN